MAANVSKDTTVKELMSIGNIPKDIFRLKNINLFFGAVNSLDYGVNMFNAPTIYEIEDSLQKDKLIKKK